MRVNLLLPLLALILIISPAFAVLTDSSLKVFAVAPDGKALAANLHLHIVPGTGQVWSSVSGPLVGTATQSTEKIAVKISKNYFADADKYDYYFSIQSNASVVDGPSAGSAMSLLVVSALKDQSIPTNVGLTGTITTTGEVGPVGGVFEKSKAAHESGIQLFLIPKGESRQVVRLDSGVQNINLPEYALKQWDMKVVEVANLDQVLKIAFTPLANVDVNSAQTQEAPAYIPPKIQVVEAEKPLNQLNTDFIKQSREAISHAQQSLNQTLLDDSGLLEVLSTSLSDSEKTVNEADLLNENGYYYSSGNLAFLAKVNAYFVDDVSQNVKLLDDANELASKLDELDAAISAQQKVLDETVPIEGFEWYIAAQQRLTWAQLNVQKLRNEPAVVVVTQDASYTANAERVHDYEFARAWLESVPQFYSIATAVSTKGLATQNPFKDYYGQFLENAQKGLTLVSDGSLDDAQRRLDAAKLDQLNGRHLSAAMNAASSLALINAHLYANDPSNDVEQGLQQKIQSLQTKIGTDPNKYAWARLYLDHAQYFLNSAVHYRSLNEGTTAADDLVSGYTLALLAENTYEVTQDVQDYYAKLPSEQFTHLTPSSNTSTGNNGGNGTVFPPIGGNGNTNGIIPISIGADGKGSVTIGDASQATVGGIPLIPVLLVVIVVACLGYVLLVRIPRKNYREIAAPEMPLGSTHSKELMAMDQLEARLFGAKTGMRHLDYQLAQGQLDNTKYEALSQHYRDEIHTVRRELREAERKLYKNAPQPMEREAAETPVAVSAVKKSLPGASLKKKRVSPTKPKKWSAKKAS